jgi:hypothetical protein
LRRLEADWARHIQIGTLQRLDVPGELVSATGHRQYEVRRSPVFAQCFPQHRNAARKVVLLDDGIGPHEFEERVLVDDRTVSLYQREQYAESLARQPDFIAAMVKPADDGIEDELSEAVEDIRRGCRGTSHRTA